MARCAQLLRFVFSGCKESRPRFVFLRQAPSPVGLPKRRFPYIRYKREVFIGALARLRVASVQGKTRQQADGTAGPLKIDTGAAAVSVACNSHANELHRHRRLREPWLGLIFPKFPTVLYGSQPPPSMKMLVDFSPTDIRRGLPGSLARAIVSPDPLLSYEGGRMS